MGFSSQGYWSGLTCPPSGDLPDPGVKPASFMHFPHWQEGSLPLVPPGKPQYTSVCVCVCVWTLILRKDLHFSLEFFFLLYNKVRTVIIFTVLCKNIVFHQFISENYGLRECLNVEGEKKEKILILCSHAFPFHNFIHSSNYPHFPG